MAQDCNGVGDTQASPRGRQRRGHGFEFVVYQMLNIVKALAARRNRGERAA